MRLKYGLGCSFILAAMLFSCALFAQAPAPTAKTTDLSFSTHDGIAMFGRLTMPPSAGRHGVVIYVQTAEGATVDMKRRLTKDSTFNYYDLYRTKLPELDVAFFSYEGRGIRMGDKPPRYEQIDPEVYNTSTLDNKVRDALSAVAAVRKQEGIDPSRIFLMGASEGTMIAAEAASRAPKEISGLILYAFLSTNLKDALQYMVADGNFLALRRLFDTNNDGIISREEFEADPKKVRESALKGVGFEVFDVNNDGSFTVEDMRIMRKPILDGLKAGSVETAEGYLKQTAVVSTPKGWVKDHFDHREMWTFIEPLTIPIGVFHGDADNLTSIDAVKKFEERCKKAGKTNVRFQYFQGLDHTLGIGSYFVDGKLPAGHQAIFDFVKVTLAPKESSAR